MTVDYRYFARGAQVFYLHPVDVTEELFLTVHPTKDCTRTPEQQAEFLAQLLNDLPTSEPDTSDIPETSEDWFKKAQVRSG